MINSFYQGCMLMPENIPGYVDIFAEMFNGFLDEESIPVMKTEIVHDN